jgi:hypothetical protein
MADPKVRMDRSRDFSTVHGERPAGDRHATVHFYQDKLPFDAAGFLIADHPDITENPELIALVERKLKKAAKQKIDAPGDEHDADSDDADNDTVNLEAWARGEQRVQWQDVSNAIAKRFTKRVVSKQAAIEFLIDEKVVSYENLSPEHQKLVKELV